MADNKAKNNTDSNKGVFEAGTNQNYRCEGPFVENPPGSLKKLVGTNLSLWDISKSHKEVSLISFNKKEYSEKEKKDRQILAVGRKNINGVERYYIKTGLYAGRITYNGVIFDIQPDCNELLFKQMLNYANHIYIDKTDELGKKQKDNKFLLIEYLFLSSLQRVSVLGLPQEYSKKNYHDLKVHGGLDVKNYIKKDIPFKGKISSQKNERHYVQCIVDVLYSALKACRGEIERNFTRLSVIKSELSASYSGKFPSIQIMQNAQNHKSLHNPVYSDFKRTLMFAEVVIRQNSILPDNSKEAKSKASGYLLDIASLWEVYLEHVLREGLKDEWIVSAQEEINLYKGCFFARPNYPDFVLRKKDDNNKVAILDAKFKRMGFKNGDVDRSDLHQIHSYAGYYREKGDTVVLCSLIYPLSVDLEKEEKTEKKYFKNRSTTLYGIDKSETTFAIDGIYKGKKIVENKKQNEDNENFTINFIDEDEESNSYKNIEVDDVEGYKVADAEADFIRRINELLEKSENKKSS